MTESNEIFINEDELKFYSEVELQQFVDDLDELSKSLTTLKVADDIEISFE